MNKEELTQNYWEYYLKFEYLFITSLSFSDLKEENFGSCSMGYALMLQGLGAEIDTFFKEFCGLNASKNNKRMTHYAQYFGKISRMMISRL